MSESTDVEDFLEHFGVRGMKWGVTRYRSRSTPHNARRDARRDSLPGVPKATNREARKDAEEFARASMYYGKGAGTRRKLIKATIKAKESKDFDYARSIDFHINKQDMSSHASKATSERKRTDRKESVRKTTGAAARKVTGEMGNSAALIAVAAAGVGFLRSPKGRETMRNTTVAVRVWANSGRARQVRNTVTSIINNTVRP